MLDDRRTVAALIASLSLGVAACGSSSTAPLNSPSVVTDTVTLIDSMYNDSVWTVLLGSNPNVLFNARVATIAATAITPAIAANGLVLVYMNIAVSPDSAAQWMPLPYSVGTLYLQTFTYAYSAGEIKIGYYLSTTDSNFGTPNVYGLIVPTAQFKIVVASGSAGSLLADRQIE